MIALTDIQIALLISFVKLNEIWRCSENWPMHTASFIDLKQFSLIPKIRKRFSREREKGRYLLQQIEVI